MLKIHNSLVELGFSLVNHHQKNFLNSQGESALGKEHRPKGRTDSLQ